MAALGYSALAIDGATEGLRQAELKRPEVFGRHRPDAVGCAPDGRLCIGEAKTAGDFGSHHTREQLEDYLVARGSTYPLVLLGYPRSADAVVRSLLSTIGALDCPQLELIAVPDELLND
jgi:hypothetical protein